MASAMLDNPARLPARVPWAARDRCPALAEGCIDLEMKSKPWRLDVEGVTMGRT
jgi:hypothetical protein